MKNKYKLILAAAFFIGLHSKAADLKNRDPNTGFVENRGQVADQYYQSRADVLYLFSTYDFKLVLRKNGFSYEQWSQVSSGANKNESGIDNANLDEDDAGAAIEIRERSLVNRIDIGFVNCKKNIDVTGSDPENFFLNFYTSANPQTEVPVFNKVTYKNVYKDIDLVFSFTEDQSGKRVPQYEWYIHPGGKSGNIQLSYYGAAGISVNPDGSLHAVTALGFINETKPVAFFDDGTSKRAISFIVKNNSISFGALKTGLDKTLIIDPVISWGTYYGGRSLDLPDEIAVDSSGNSYITGRTKSSSKIATSNAFDTHYDNEDDIFLARYNSNGKLKWATYYGGRGDDVAYGVLVDPNQQVVIGGKTKSDTGIASYAGKCTIQCKYTKKSLDGFLAKFTADKGTLKMSTYLGGPGNDEILGIACDAAGDIYASGYTESDTGIVLGDVEDSTYGDFLDPDTLDGDIIMMKFNNALTERIWGSYYGSSGRDRGHNVCVDPFGHVYQSGTIEGSSKNLATWGAWDKSKSGGLDAFICSWTSTGKVAWFTYYGGSTVEHGRGICADEGGNVYNVGYTNNVCKDTICFDLASQGSFKTVHPTPDDDGFVVKFDSTGQRIWASYFGGRGNDIVRSIKVAPAGAPIYIEGMTRSGNNPVTEDAYQKVLNGKSDNFFAKINWEGSQLIYSSFYGGAIDETPYNNAYYEGTLDIDPAGNIYIASCTNSEDSISTDGTSILRPDQMDVYVVKFTDACGGDEDPFEPNDNYGKAPNLPFNPVKNTVTIHALIQQSNDVDYFAIVPPTPYLKVILSGLSANYDLYLYNVNEEEVGYSTNAGLTEDTILFNNVIVGERYYVAVIPIDSFSYSANQCYTLSLSGSTIPFRMQSNLAPGSEEEFVASLFPNPATSASSLIIRNKTRDDFTVTIFDLPGNMISSERHHLLMGDHSIPLNTENLSGGSYLVQINTGTKQSVLKLALIK
ncbi:MAG: SBBP repeat-containing protein [Chitinophagales bacterium]|nr:SBBP repeat-containing protein [Chitinophagales bacterium]